MFLKTLDKEERASCPWCASVLRLWPDNLSPLKFLCDGQCPIESGTVLVSFCRYCRCQVPLPSGSTIRNTGINLYFCFGCNFHMCLMCVSELKKSIPDQGLEPSAPPLDMLSVKSMDFIFGPGYNLEHGQMV